MAASSIKDFLKSLPVVGSLLLQIQSKLNRLRPNFLYTYSFKPLVINQAIKLLRRMVLVDSTIISQNSCVVDTGTAKFTWRPADPYSLLGYPLRGDFEKIETDIAMAIAKHAECIVDVGGNFGWYSCHLQASMPVGGELHVFEPVPAVREELLKNLALNPREGVKTVVTGFCLSDAAGEVVLHVPNKLGSAFASLRNQNYDGGFERVAVQATTLDSYCSENNITHIDLLKIDVEGAELQVLQGARAMLSAPRKPVLFIESEASIIDVFGRTVQEVINYIQGFGYCGYIVKNDKLHKLTNENIGIGYDYIFVDPAAEFPVQILQSVVEKS
ncbi:MAG: FkbM family methyltransferase [Steroidobacteraceae bacterium]|nr:FkbM family methyltransferase [Deltaproteobacteria bacterium]